MPVQVQQGSLASKLGGRLAQVSAQLSGKPLNLGRQRLPGGIKGAVARLQSMVWKVQDKEGGKIPKGEIYFSGAAVVVWPLEHAGMRIVGSQTFFQIPLCDMPATKYKGAVPFIDNFDKFRSLLEDLGIGPCKETDKTDPTGQKTEAYWKAAMASLCDPKRPGGAALISFSTREFTPDKPPGWKEGDKVPETMVLEEWHGKGEMPSTAKVTGGVNVITSNGAAQPTTSDAPPTIGPDGLPNSSVHSMAPDSEQSIEDEVTTLVATCVDDPQGETEEGQLAGKRLTDLAWGNGWTEAQTDEADWEQVGHMALHSPEEQSDETPEAVEKDWVGVKVMYSRRDKSGNKLTDQSGKEFPAQEFIVTSVDGENKTCTLKFVKDGKDLLDVRSKKPSQVKLEWLE